MGLLSTIPAALHGPRLYGLTCTIDTAVNGIVRQAPLVMLRILIGLIVFSVFWLISSLLQRLIERISDRADARKRDMLRLLNKTARVALLLFGAVSALGTMGIDVTALVAGLGLTGFALGFALRDALSNFLAGALILIYRPFRRGERIKVGDFDGVVLEIDLRYTTLQADGRRFLVPNSFLFTHPITLFDATGNSPG